VEPIDFSAGIFFLRPLLLDQGVNYLKYITHLKTVKFFTAATDYVKRTLFVGCPGKIKKKKSDRCSNK